MAGLALLNDAREMLEALSRFPVRALLIMLALSLGCFMVRGLRWGRLMAAVGSPVSALDANYCSWQGRPWRSRPAAWEKSSSRGSPDLLAQCP